MWGGGARRGGREREGDSGEGKGEDDEWAPRVVVGMRRWIKDDGCGRMKYKVENLDDEVGIFCFEGGFKVSRAWIVLHAQGLYQNL
jgi:hypothetical protein